MAHSLTSLLAVIDRKRLPVPVNETPLQRLERLRAESADAIRHAKALTKTSQELMTIAQRIRRFLREPELRTDEPFVWLSLDEFRDLDADQKTAYAVEVARNLERKI